MACAGLATNKKTNNIQINKKIYMKKKEREREKEKVSMFSNPWTVQVSCNMTECIIKYYKIFTAEKKLY